MEEDISFQYYRFRLRTLGYNLLYDRGSRLNNIFVQMIKFLSEFHSDMLMNG